MGLTVEMARLEQQILVVEEVAQQQVLQVAQVVLE
jgi:hypothetical protein